MPAWTAKDLPQNHAYILPHNPQANTEIPFSNFKKITNSKLIVRLTGRFSITTGFRSSIALFDAYTAGVANQAGGANNIMYQHYGLYNASGGDIYQPGAYEVTITGISANTAKTGDMITLAYSSANAVVQPLASNTETIQKDYVSHPRHLESHKQVPVLQDSVQVL